jgi:hypothetical protein
MQSSFAVTFKSDDFCTALGIPNADRQEPFNVIMDVRCEYALAISAERCTADQLASFQDGK